MIGKDVQTKLSPVFTDVGFYLFFSIVEHKVWMYQNWER